MEKHVSRGAMDAVDVQEAPISANHKDCIDADATLEQLAGESLLDEIVQSLVNLFGLSVRVYSADNKLVSSGGKTCGLCEYLQQRPGSRHSCISTLEALDAAGKVNDDNPEHPCFSGAHYRVANLMYDGHYAGRIVLGPYVPIELTVLPRSLAVTAPNADPAQLRQLMVQMPRLRPDVIASMIAHATTVIDIVLFAGHKTYLTSQLHLTSMRQSFDELQASNAQLRDAYDKLKELDQLKSNFIATVSHELRTPLTSIIGYGEMLAEGMAGPLSAQQHEFVTTIREKSEQLLSLIMTLLDLSKFESGTLSLVKDDIDVEKILHDVASMLKPTAHKAGILMHVQVPNKMPALRADATRLHQALLNIAENAIKFTPSGGEVTLSAAVHLDLNATTDMLGYSVLAPAKMVVEIRIADTGIGIPDNQRQKIFGAFYQVDSSSTRQFSGTGLGLAIVQRLIHAHKGTISVHSNQPVGTVFVIRLPMYCYD